MEEHKQISEEELVKRIETAARKGARSGSRRSGMFSGLLNLVIMMAVAFVIFNNFSIKNPFERETPVENHDLTLRNYGILGYTAADFAEAILGKEARRKELVVYEAEVSDASTITKAGLGKFKVFSKCQLITYHGTAIYVVNLTDLSEKDIDLDEQTKTVTIRVPHAERKEINVPSDKIEFGDTERGLLAFGSIKLTPEEQSKVQTEAVNKMKKKLDDMNANATADRFATLSVWEIYQPLVTSVSPEYKLEIKFK